MQVIAFAYKYLRHAVFLLGVICLLFIGRNGYSYQAAPEFAETTFVQDNDDNFSQEVASEGLSTDLHKHHLSTLHRRHHTARRFLEKPGGKEFVSWFIGSFHGIRFGYIDTLLFSAGSCSARLRYYVLLYLYALF